MTDPVRVVLVYGGREFRNRKWLYDVLGTIHYSDPIRLIVNGGQDGADKLSSAWANARGVFTAVFEVSDGCWDEFGVAAGPIRNGLMTLLPIEQAVEFPGGRGTASMRKICRASQIPIHTPEYPSGY